MVKVYWSKQQKLPILKIDLCGIAAPSLLDLLFLLCVHQHGSTPPNDFIHPQQLSEGSCPQSSMSFSCPSFSRADLKDPRDDILTLVSRVHQTYNRVCVQDQGHWILSLDIAFQLALPSRFTYQKNKSYPHRAPKIKDSEQTWILSQLLLLNGSPERSLPGSAGKIKSPSLCTWLMPFPQITRINLPLFSENETIAQTSRPRAGADQEASLLTLSPVLCQARSHGPHLRCSCQMGETDMFVTFTAQPFEFCSNELRWVPGTQKGGS